MDDVREVPGATNGGHWRGDRSDRWRASERCPEPWIEVIGGVPRAADGGHPRGGQRLRARALERCGPPRGGRRWKWEGFMGDLDQCGEFLLDKVSMY
jgi:hypothetical protein